MLRVLNKEFAIKESVMPLLSRRLAVILLASLLAWPSTLFAGKKPKRLSNQEMSTAWLGISESELYLYRIVLNKDGTGTGAFSFLDDQPVLFDIVSWSYDKKIRLQLKYHGEARGYPEKISGELVGEQMKLLLRGETWKMEVHLRQEGPLLERWRRLAGLTGFEFPIDALENEDDQTDRVSIQD